METIDLIPLDLKAKRIEAGLTIYRLAKLSGISKQTISNIEAGKVQPLYITVCELLWHCNYVIGFNRLLEPMTAKLNPLPVGVTQPEPTRLPVEFKELVNTTVIVDGKPLDELKDTLPDRWKVASKPEPMKPKAEQVAKLKQIIKAKS